MEILVEVMVYQVLYFDFFSLHVDISCNVVSIYAHPFLIMAIKTFPQPIPWFYQFQNDLLVLHYVIPLSGFL